VHFKRAKRRDNGKKNTKKTKKREWGERERGEERERPVR